MINSSIKFLLTGIAVIVIIAGSIISFKNNDGEFAISKENKNDKYELDILDDQGKFIKTDFSLNEDEILISALSFNKLIYKDYIKDNKIRFIDFKDSDYIISNNIVPTITIRNIDYYSIGAIKNIINDDTKNHLSFHLFDFLEKNNTYQLKKELHSIRRDLSVEVRFKLIDSLTEDEIEMISDYYKSIPKPIN